jgi:hypothetical protein
MTLPLVEILAPKGFNKLHAGEEEVNLIIKNNRIRLVSSHGLGGSPEKVLRNMEQNKPGADIYFIGHSHKFLNLNEGYNQDYNINGIAIQSFACLKLVGGSFQNYSDYAQTASMRKTQTGCYILTLSENGVERINKFI